MDSLVQKKKIGEQNNSNLSQKNVTLLFSKQHLAMEKHAFIVLVLDNFLENVLEFIQRSVPPEKIRTFASLKLLQWTREH